MAHCSYCIYYSNIDLGLTKCRRHLVIISLLCLPGEGKIPSTSHGGGPTLTNNLIRHTGAVNIDKLNLQQRLYTDDLLRMQVTYSDLYGSVYGRTNICDIKPKDWVANAVQSQDEGARLLSCQFCGRLFDAMRKLKRHIIIHSSVRYRCSRCPKTFTHPEYLSQHIKVVHTMVKRHRCPYCSRILSTRQRMKLHSDKCPYKPMDLAQRPNIAISNHSSQ